MADPVGPAERLRVLLIEDDAADVFLVRELLAEANAAVDLSVAASVGEARHQIARADCVLLDLGLPDATGIAALRQVMAMVAESTAEAAVCVLTGLEDEHVGIAAVAEGAQDYLSKGQVDGVLLARAIRYAVERRRAEENARRLRDAERMQAESDRLERGLLPQPLTLNRAVAVDAFYQPGRRRALLGGDFFDVVQTGPRRLEVMIGDVSGHGVEEAALGVELRVAWRALVLAGVPDEAVYPALEQVLVSERAVDDVFASVLSATVDAEAGTVTVRSAGHPPAVLVRGGEIVTLREARGMVLGISTGVRRAPVAATLGRDGWSLLLYTDGLIEGRNGDGRLGIDGLCALLAHPDTAGRVPADLLAWLAASAERANGGPLADDVAMLLLTPGEDA
ncbi:MAG: PP2C family protein-serine/threonine phosphatase [Mycobacteriales bacterium]